MATWAPGAELWIRCAYVQCVIEPWATAWAVISMLLTPRLQFSSRKFLTSPMVMLEPVPVNVNPLIVTFCATLPAPFGPMTPIFPPSPLLVKLVMVIPVLGGVIQNPLRAPHCWEPVVYL